MSSIGFRRSSNNERICSETGRSLRKNDGLTKSTYRPSRTVKAAFAEIGAAIPNSDALPRTGHQEVGYESARVDLVLATAVGPAPVTKLATFNGFLY